MNASATNTLYNNAQSIAELRARAQKDPDAVLREVAGQFESLFVEMMMKSMREAGASFGGGLFESNEGKIYQEMMDKQLAKNLSSSGGGMGLADMLVRQLGGGKGAAPISPDRGYAVRHAMAAPGAGAAEEGSVLAAAGAPSPFASAAVSEGEGAWPPESPEAFVRAVWPHAQRAAEDLGVDPSVLVAQAALETGWGKAVSRHEDGRSSHNLFNIKADRRWDGDHVTISTLEYRDGVPMRERADFRAYDSFAESFEDYVDFLRSNPRYGEALTRVGDSRAFVQGLQEAGYATDPAYAEKIGSILARDHLREVVAELKSEPATPLT